MSEAICPACGASGFEERESIDVAGQHSRYAPGDEQAQRSLTAAALETALTYRMLACRRCGLEFSDPMKAASATWCHFCYSSLGSREMTRWDFDEVIRRIPSGKSLFEFGCGYGPFLTLCKEHGISAVGADFVEGGIAHCLAHGLKAQLLDLDEAAAPADSERVSHLAAFHVLEHLDRPGALFEHARARALPDAELWVAVPSDRRATRRYGVTDDLDQPPHHMTRWTEPAFREIGKSHGWRLTETLYEPLSLRTALWSITYYSASYRKREAAGQLKNRWMERGYRALMLPPALSRRLTSDRQLSGLSMVAHFTRGDAVEA
jgi:Methyltransferase domain